MTIHSEDPFSVPTELRDPVRRLRGRLAAPVTVLTAMADHDSQPDRRPVGLTVSSFFVIEGEVPRTAALVGPGSDFVEAAEDSGTFVAHVLGGESRNLADVFAGLRPSPGGMFTGSEIEETDWGPRLADIEDWVGCRLEESRELGDQLVLVGVIETLALSELTDPLINFRGSYRKLAP